MNRDDDFNHTLEAWLRREAPSQAPDRVLDAALDRVATESQRPGWLQRIVGGTLMGVIVRATAVAAVVAIAVIVGLQFASLTPDVGGTLPSPSEVGTRGPTAIPTPSSAERTPSSECINPPVDLLTLVYQSDPVACYANGPLTVDAYLTGVGAIDGPCLFIEPAWFACDAWVALEGVRKTATTTSIILAATSGPGYYAFFAAVHPTLGTDVLRDRNVRVTGHFDDPAAQTCQQTELVGGAETLAPAAEMIEACRRIFVVTQVVPLEP